MLKYDDPHEDHTAKLESLREQCLAADPNARSIYACYYSKRKKSIKDDASNNDTPNKLKTNLFYK